MGCEIEQMYLDLKNLLEDICKFLSTDKLDKLSPKDQRLAESLIDRSKTQLQNITKIQPTLQCNEDYVVMNSQVNNEEEEKSIIYSSVDDVHIKSESPVIIENESKPFEDLPAKDASKDVKYGMISMKRRFFIGIEIMKRVYACIHEGWLLIYCTEKDMKPLCTFDLKNYEAKESQGEKCNFELVSTTMRKKIYQFLALTHKDMLQWTVQINRYHDNLIMDEKNIDDNDSDRNSERKYSNGEAESCSDDEDRIYEKLTTVKPLKEKPKPEVTSKPPLPPTRPPHILSKKPKLPIKVSPPVVKSISVSTNSSNGSLASYHEVHTVNITVNNSKSNSTKSLEDSFSDESGDSTYETFANIQQSLSPSKRSSIENIEEVKELPKVPLRKKSFQ